MSRLAVPLLAVLALAVWAMPARAEVPGDAQLIDQTTLTPDGGDAGGVWRSKELDADVEYTITVSGSYTEPYSAGGARTYDGLYCGGSASSDTACGRSGAAAIRKPSVLFQAGPSGRTKAYDGIDDLGGLKGKLSESVSGYEAQYALAVIPGAATDYRLTATILTGGQCTACSGALHVRIYGPAIASHGSVKITFLQRGLPKQHPADLRRATTSGNGTMRLAQALVGGEQAQGGRLVQKGGMTILHSEDYDIGEDHALILGVLSGTYTVSSVGEVVALRVEVIESSDPDCAIGSKGKVSAFEPANRDRGGEVLFDVCGPEQRYRRFKSGGVVHVKIVRHRPPAQARLL